MIQSFRNLTPILVCLWTVGLAGAEIDFLEQVAPIFREHCIQCHGPAKQQGGLRFDVAAPRPIAGDSGASTIVPGQADASELIRRISSSDKSDRMPPDGPALPAEHVELLRAWINQGGNWKGGSEAPLKAELAVTDRDRQHWSFRPLAPLPDLEVIGGPIASSPVDRWIVRELDTQKLSLAPRAAPATLIRRIYLDLVGLPPESEDLDAFQKAMTESGPQAIEQLVDRLLASPHYGERWARHWLDVARYADSNGQEGDQDRLNAYPYRDFVIRALNYDLPFDEFVRWQIAGDELEPDNPMALAATGFLVAGPHTVLDVPMEEEKIRNRFNELDDMISTLGSAMLGLTLGCARCHDHKYDPIPTRDYYRLLSAVQSGDRVEALLASRADIAVKDAKSLPKVLAYRDTTSEAKPAWLFHRANFYDRTEPVELGFVSVLTRNRSPREYWDAARSVGSVPSTYQRAAIANWITDIERGAGALLARVIVNRVWQHHFGEGIVRTVSDFGTQGEPPSHPELLEWLAQDFVEHGWQLKHLHRRIMLSDVYLEGSDNPAAMQHDPENRLVARRRPLKVEAEVMRDCILSVAGTINLEAFGPAFKPPIAPEAIVARNLKSPYKADGSESAKVHRRSIYMFHKRVVPYPLLQAFDRPDALQSCGRRDLTTVAPQALALLNDQFVRDQAHHFAEQLIRDCGDRIDDQVQRSFQLAFARSPTDSELSASREFILNQRQMRQARQGESSTNDVQRDALADYCQALFGLNEFIYVD